MCWQTGASGYNESRKEELEELCFPKEWEGDNFTVFPNIRAEYSNKSSVGTLSQVCLTDFGIEQMEGISPPFLRTHFADMEHENVKRNNVSTCPSESDFAAYCGRHGKVCKYTARWQIQDVVGSHINESDFKYNWTVGHFELRAQGTACAANLCDMGEYASLIHEYMQNSITPVTQEEIDYGDVSPFEFLQVVLDIDCAAGGQIPVQAIRLGLALAAEIDDIMSSEERLQQFRNTFINDVATALHVSPGLVAFVEVRSLSRRLAGSDARLLSENKVQVIFDILTPKDKSASSEALATELQSQLVNEGSDLRRGVLTSRLDPSSPVKQITDDGEEKQFHKQADENDDVTNAAQQMPIFTVLSILVGSLLLSSS